MITRAHGAALDPGQIACPSTAQSASCITTKVLPIENVTKENALQLRSAEVDNRLQLSLIDAKVTAERKIHEMDRQGRQEQEDIEERGHTRRLRLVKEEEKR